MKYSLRSLIAVSAAISLLGMTAIWLPLVFVVQLAIGTTPVRLIMNMMAALFIAGILLWMAKIAWNDSQKMEQDESAAIHKPRNEPPSWGKPPPLLNSSSRAPNPPTQ